MKFLRITKHGPHIADLRNELAKRDDVNVHIQGGQWIISRWIPVYKAWVETPCHFGVDERGAIMRARGIEAD